MILLPKVIYDQRARDGTWCCLPYPNHPKGCPKFPKCPSQNDDFLSLKGNYLWYAVIEEFDLKIQAEKMKRKNPKWTDRQCRNLIYWQKGVRFRLLEKAYALSKFKSLILTIPEASGINVFETMARVGIQLERNPNTVRKIMLVGMP